MSLPDEATENLLAQPGLDSVEQDANSFDQLSFIGPNYFETPLLPVPMPSLDTIFLRNVRLSAAIGYDAWYRVNQLQPITLTLQLFVDRSNAGISDDIKDTFSYGQMYKEVIGMADGNSFSSMDHLALSVVDLFNNWPGCMIKIRVFAPKSVLRVEGGVTKECVWRRAPADTSLKPHGSLKGHAWMIDSLKIACIIGVNSHERVHKQIVNISLRIIGNLEPAAYHDQIRRAMGCWGPLVNRLCEVSREFQGTLGFFSLLIIRVHSLQDRGSLLV